MRWDCTELWAQLCPRPQLCSPQEREPRLPDHPSPCSQDPGCVPLDEFDRPAARTAPNDDVYRCALRTETTLCPRKPRTSARGTEIVRLLRLPLHNVLRTPDAFPTTSSTLRSDLPHSCSQDPVCSPHTNCILRTQTKGFRTRVSETCAPGFLQTRHANHKLAHVGFS